MSKELSPVDRCRHRALLMHAVINLEMRDDLQCFVWDQELASAKQLTVEERLAERVVTPGAAEVVYSWIVAGNWGKAWWSLPRGG